MEPSEFEQIVLDAIENLPPAFLPYLENVEVIVERRPSREIRRRVGLKPWQTLYGLYDGVPITEREGWLSGPPDTIYIFQDTLERDFRSRSILQEEIQRTVLHEIAHHFGIDDDRLRELGAY